MELQKINVKFFTADSHDPPLTDFIDLFHGWIQATDGLYHDVADYSHMQAGPGIVLVANDANLSIDETDHRRGLLFSQKARLSGSSQERLRTVLRSALENCRRLEQEPTLRGKVRFLGNEALISINDRLVASNTDDAFETVKPEIESVATILFGTSAFVLERDKDPRKRLNIQIKASRLFGLDELVRNLHNTQKESRE
jgi:hypothetical protein